MRTTSIAFPIYSITISLLISISAFADVPRLVKDIETLRQHGIDSRLRVALSDTLEVFEGSDAAHGREPWVSDGSAAGTKLLKDINPGPDRSEISEMVVVFLNGGGSRAIFTATSPNEGAELWESDGTIAGTRLVRDLVVGPGSSFPGSLTPVGAGLLAFTATTDATGQEIFIYDIAANTVTPRELNPGTTSSVPNSLSFMSGENALYFSGNTSADGTELRRLKINTGVITTIANICPAGESSFPGGVTSSLTFPPDTFLVFSAIDCAGNKGRELFRTTGSPPSGAVLLKDINPGAGSSLPGFGGQLFTPFGTKLIFAADNGTTGIEPWVTDGRPNGTVPLGDLLPGPQGSIGSFVGAEAFSVTDNGVVFGARANGVGVELFKTLGSAASTSLLLDIKPGPESSFPENFGRIGSLGKVIFSADDGVNGSELWITDGQPSGTKLLADLNPGQKSSGIFAPNAGPSTSFFSAITSDDEALFRTDGTENGTQVFASTSDPTATENADIEFCTSLGKKTFLQLSTRLTGEEGWMTDGTATGTDILKDINPGVNGSSPGNAITLNGKLLFFAGDDLHGRELWTSDGTGPGTQLVADINSGNGDSISFSEIVLLGKSAIFAANDGVTGVELYRTDGTLLGTQLIKDIKFGPGSSDPANLVVAGNVTFFTADDGVRGRELWITDGSANGTKPVTEITPDGLDPRFSNLISLGSKIIFGANDGVNKDQLWVSDGSAEGTKPITNFPNGMRSSGGAVINGVAILQINNFITGEELWRSDGTAAGTFLIKEFKDGPESGSPQEFTILGDKIVFSASTANEGSELWLTDGSNAGTLLLRDINLGSADSFPNNLKVESGFVFFGADDGVTGQELWRSDGTPAGTVPVADIVPGPTSSNVFGLCGNNGILYMSATTDALGAELFGLVVDACPDDPAKLEVGVCGCGVPDTDLNINGVLDCLANQDLAKQIAKVQRLLTKIKPASSSRAKKRLRSNIALIKGSLGNLKLFSSAQAAFIRVTARSSFDKLLASASKKVKRALNVKSAKFRVNKSQATKALKSLRKALL